MSGYYVYETRRQLDGSYIGDGKDLYICNMDYAAAAMTNGSQAPGNMGLEVEAANITAATDVLGNTKACVLAGTAYMYSTSCPLVGSDDYSLAISVYYADWATVGADQTIFSQMDVTKNNGWKLYLATADKHLHLIHRSGGATTLDLDYNSSGVTLGWHNIAVSVNRNVAQVLYFDGVAVVSATDAADDIGTPTEATDTISGISKAKLAVITCTGAHGLTSGDIVKITGVVGQGAGGSSYDLHGMDTLNGNTYVVTVTAVDAFSIPIKSTNFDTYVSGGTVTFYPRVHTVVGAHTDGTDVLTGRVDEIILQRRGYWAAGVPKLLDAVLGGDNVILENDGDVKVISVS